MPPEMSRSGLVSYLYLKTKTSRSFDSFGTLAPTLGGFPVRPCAWSRRAVPAGVPFVPFCCRCTPGDVNENETHTRKRTIRPPVSGGCELLWTR